jgi:NADPH:quinone reductase-like Zn-dependent oxidoreductase
MGLMIRGMLAAKLRQAPIRFFDAKPSAANLATIRELAESGALKPVVDRSYPLEQAAEAIRYMETEHARAKVVLVV